MQIAIIGAGISGLLCAYRLAEEFEVSIFERENYPGGLCSSVSFDNLQIEKYNHFFSRYDKEIIRVINELGLSGSLSWKKARQGSIIDGKFFDMSRPLSLFGLPGINIFERMRFAAFLVKASIANDGLRFNQQTARVWVEGNCTKNVFERYFKPLLEFKFQNYGDVSAGYLWARIKEGKRNDIGALSGGMGVLLESLMDKIRGRGAKIILGKTIKRIERTLENKWRLYDNESFEEFDCVLCCISLKETVRLCNEELKNILNIPDADYLNAGSYILKLKRPLRQGYWLFVNHKERGLSNVIIDASSVTGNNIVYCRVYRRTGSITERDREKIFNNCLSALRNINPDFDQTWIEKKMFHADNLVEPVLTNEFIDQLFSGGGRVEGFYLPEAMYERHLLKTVNTQAEKAKLIFRMIMERNSNESSNTG
ncbi:MAG: FAD-dependent oxidoreductase [Candidatus Omnitrophica bacterium]|nr:FAD-dependent oxidoreductase [Candidatus Omnitrophota bacterium]